MLRNGAMPMAARSDFKCDTAARTRTPILTKICTLYGRVRARATALSLTVSVNSMYTDGPVRRDLKPYTRPETRTREPRVICKALGLAT